MNTQSTLATVPDALDENLNHFYCCDENRALCGLDLTQVPETDEDIDCVVCLDLEGRPCSATCDWKADQ